MTASRRFSAFVEDLDAIMAAAINDDAARQSSAADALARLIAQDDWLDPCYAVPDKEHYRQYLLHLDPAARFSVVSFVWSPGQKTAVHNHTVWGLVGVLRGAEESQMFVLRDGVPEPREPRTMLKRGEVDFVSPRHGDIHQVRNAIDGVSVSIHVYGGDIGRSRRSVYRPDGSMAWFVSGYNDPRGGQPQ